MAEASPACGLAAASGEPVGCRPGTLRFPALPRRNRGLNTSSRLDCSSSSENETMLSMMVGGMNAHQAPVRMEPQAIAQ